MLREQCHVGMEVIFGRTRGEKTRGKVVKVNQKTANVVTLETRGTQRVQGPGGKWKVPFTLMEPANGQAVDDAPPPRKGLEPWQESLRLHVRNFLAVASHEEMIKEWELSKDRGDTLRRVFVADMIAEYWSNEMAITKAETH